MASNVSQEFERSGHSVRGLANWILDLADREQCSITNMALNKLVFFAIEVALIARRALLTNARIEAWDHGPVLREVYQAFKQSGDKPIKGRISFYSVDTRRVERPSISLDDDLVVLLEKTLIPLLPLSASRLRNLSHVAGGAWHQVWSYDGFANPGMEITPSVILEASSLQGNQHA